MSQAAVKAIETKFGSRVLEKTNFRGDESVYVVPRDWREVATFLRESELDMQQFIDLTAVDYPEREPDDPRFEVILRARSVTTKARITLKTKLEDGASLATLTDVWPGANWAEREVWDMFGIKFDGHPDMRRILMYEEFEGFPLRKDYPIDRTQPLVEYRENVATHKLAPFGQEEGQPFARIQWDARIKDSDNAVSPAIARQLGQRRALSDSEIAIAQAKKGDHAGAQNTEKAGV